MMKLLNMIIVLSAERVQHGGNVCILRVHGLMGQSTVNIAKCLYYIGCILYLGRVEPAVYCEP